MPLHRLFRSIGRHQSDLRDRYGGQRNDPGLRQTGGRRRNQPRHYTGSKRVRGECGSKIVKILDVNIHSVDLYEKHLKEYQGQH